MTTNLFKPAGLDINDGGTSVYLGHIGDQSADFGLDKFTVRSAGDFAPSSAGAKGFMPTYQVNSFDVVEALDLMTEQHLARDVSAGNIDLLYRKMKPQAMQYPTTASEHAKYRLQQNALLYWDSLQVSKDDEGARIAVRVDASDNGTNAPLQTLVDQTLPAAAGAASLYTIGAVDINGTRLGGIQSLQWQNNVKLMKIQADGATGATIVVIEEVTPTISIDTTNIEFIKSTYGDDGFCCTSLAVYLRKRKPCKVNHLDTETVHVKLSATNGGGAATDPCAVLQPQGVSGSPGMGKLEITLVRATGQPLFSYAKDVAIP